MGWITEPAEAYHSRPAMSSHALKTLLRSPLHYHTEFIRGIRPEPTPAMRIGTLLHMAVLEPEVFKQKFRVPPKVDRRTKEGKEVYAAFEASLKPGDVVVTEEETKVLYGVAESIAKHRLAKNLLSGGVAEQSGYFTHPLGVPAKARLDYRIPKAVVTDLKFVFDASYKEFQRSISKYRYDVSAAWYLDAVSILDEVDASNLDFCFIAIEKTPPFAVAVYNADVALIEAGRRRCEKALRLYQQCQAKNEWPGYGEAAQVMTLPRWDNDE